MVPKRPKVQVKTDTWHSTTTAPCNLQLYQSQR